MPCLTYLIGVRYVIASGETTFFPMMRKIFRQMVNLGPEMRRTTMTAKILCDGFKQIWLSRPDGSRSMQYEVCKGCPKCVLPPRLRYCKSCGIVTMGTRQAYCHGIVMHFKHPRKLTVWVDDAKLEGMDAGR